MPVRTPKPPGELRMHCGPLAWRCGSTSRNCGVATPGIRKSGSRSSAALLITERNAQRPTFNAQLSSEPEQHHRWEDRPLSVKRSALNVERSGGAGPAVFVSYASQDSEAAKNICDALRAAGVEVWFDQSELVGGDAWDQKIKKQIRECALFVPIISPTTNARAEGYFRREWKQAVERTHDMADDVPFLFPIVIGDVTDATARVPDKFREVQWTRLKLEETAGELATRIARLLSGDVAGVGDPGPASARPATRRAGGVPHRWQWWMIFPIFGMTMGLILALKERGPATARPIQAPDPKPQTLVPIQSEARQ